VTERNSLGLIILVDDSKPCGGKIKPSLLLSAAWFSIHQGMPH
jgi:hypothetical protein